MPSLNRYLSTSSLISSKSISQYAREHADVLDLSIGEPAFGPPPNALDGLLNTDAASLTASLKRYEQSRGDPTLRQAIAEWYADRYGLKVDPEREILVTHGGMEAVNVALLAVSEAGSSIGIFDPGYALYARLVNMTGRLAHPLRRAPAVHEFAHGMAPDALSGLSALILNSPENPTGYVASEVDLAALADAADRADCWIVHDEVYDTLAHARPHRCVRAIPALARRSVLVNSCSKKFGVPGLRIGWLVADANVVDIATRVHEGLCLSVNLLAENTATRLLKSTPVSWFDEQRDAIAVRQQRLEDVLGTSRGIVWSRQAAGGLFAFPNVCALHARLPKDAHTADLDAGSAVARWLLESLRIATVPGGVYGSAGVNHLRLATGVAEATFDEALVRFRDLP